MNIKQLFFVLIALLSTQLIQAQASKVSTAYFLMEDYNLEKTLKSLVQAKEAINEAAANEATMNAAKTWYYRGLIYNLLATNPETSKDGTDYTNEALTSFQKALSFNDKKFADKDKAILQLKDLAATFFNNAIEKQKAAKYTEAFADYAKVEEINQLVVSNGAKMQFDASLATRNKTLVADEAGMYKEAISGYNTLIEEDPKSTYYVNLANIYRKQENDEMFNKTMDKAAVEFPDNADVIIAQLNYLIAKGKTAEATDKIDKAISLQPTNEMLYFVKAKTLDDMGNREEAIKTYEKAIEIKPNFADAYYNLGAIYFLQGNPIIEKMNKLTTSPADTKIYNELVEERKELYRKAKTYFDKVIEIKPDDAMATSTIKKIERVLNQ